MNKKSNIKELKNRSEPKPLFPNNKQSSSNNKPLFPNDKPSSPERKPLSPNNKTLSSEKAQEYNLKENGTIARKSHEVQKNKDQFINKIFDLSNDQSHSKKIIKKQVDQSAVKTKSELQEFIQKNSDVFQIKGPDGKSLEIDKQPKTISSRKIWSLK